MFKNLFYIFLTISSFCIFFNTNLNVIAYVQIDGYRMGSQLDGMGWDRNWMGWDGILIGWDLNWMGWDCHLVFFNKESFDQFCI